MKILLALGLIFFAKLVFAQGKFFGGNGDGFAGTTAVGVTLPVQQVNFIMYTKGQKTYAELAVSSNEKLCRICLERSNGGNSFYGVDSLEVRALVPESYFELVDPSPMAGNNYYRIRVTSCNFLVFYSRVLLLKIEKNKNQLYYSYPEKSIRYTANENSLLEIINSDGQVVWSKKIMAGTGIIPVLSGLHGIYFVRFAGKPARAIVLQ